MGSTNSKVDCLLKPGQSGKTRTMQQRIKEYAEWSQLWGDGKSALNIVVSSNNRGLVAQTTARMNDDIFESVSTLSEDSNAESDDKIAGSCFSWSSGTKKTNISTDALAWKIINNDIAMVVCCAHKTRLAYLFKLVCELNRCPMFDRKINVFIDEADESIKLWSSPAFDITQFEKVTSIMLVSATFDSVIKHYGRIRVIPLVDTYNAATYVKLAECLIIEDDTVGSAFDYIKGVFVKHTETLMKPGIRLFAPGNVQKTSHNDIAEFLRTKGYSVMILNGDRKCIVKPDGYEISIADHMDDENPEEIGRVMTRIYYDNGLDKGLFAVTGQLCLGRGITFQNDRFLFDFGILPVILNQANAYQCACRMIGNIRLVLGYQQSTIVTPMKMKHTILERENVAVTLARRVFDENLSDVGEEDFGIAPRRSDEDENMSIPKILTISPDVVETLRGSNTKQKRARIFKLLVDNGEGELASKLKAFRCKQVTCPNADKQYSKVVTGVVAAAQAGRRPGVFKLEERLENIWQAVIDSRLNRLIITYYSGAM